MFDFDIGKLIVFGIVALAVIPPKDLPRVMRTVGKYVGQMRRMAADFRGQFDAAIKEVEFESIKKELDEINEAANIDTSFDPAALMRDNLEKAVEDKPAGLEDNRSDYESATAESEAKSSDYESKPFDYESKSPDDEAKPLDHDSKPSDYETMMVEAPAPPPEPVAVEITPQKAASSAT